MPTLQDVAGDTGIFTDGNWILSENMDANGKYGVIQLKHVGIGEFLEYKDFNFINEKTFNDLRCTEVLPGDILISRMADPIGRACIVPQLPFPCVTAVDVTIVRVDKNIAEPEFVMYLCNSPSMREKIDRVVRGTTRARITRTELGELEIPLPPLDEQKRIASLLARADRLRQLRRAARRLADSLLQSVFVEMFGEPRINPKKWELAKFEDVCESRLGKMLDEKKQTGKHKRKYLRNFNVQWFQFDLSDIAEMDFDEKDRKEFRLQYGDILMCEGGEVGRCAIWKNQIEECYFQKALHRIRPNPEFVKSEYLVHLFWWLAQTGGLGDFTSQVTIAHLTGEKLKELVIPIPPLSLQEEFARVAARVEGLRARQAEAERQAEELFQSLLAESFAPPQPSPNPVDLGRVSEGREG